MPRIHQEFSIPFQYDVHFTREVFQPENETLAQVLAQPGEGRKKVLAVLDEGLVAHHPDLSEALGVYADVHSEAMHLVQAPLVVPGGETAKNNPELVMQIHRALYDQGIDRHAFVLAVGGGAVLDLVGYAAATAHRGVRLIRVPTTVLSQNDSGVGVKNGINAFGAKNFVGTFAPPFAVLNDPTFLTTLDDRDWRGGISEAIKVALIKDTAFFDVLEQDASQLAPPQRTMAAMERLIYRCAELHVEHIATAGDPFEMGSSRPLDFGHWAAHRLEYLTNYAIRHGEAVAIGIALDTTYSYLHGLLDEATWTRIITLFEQLGLPLYAPELNRHLDDPSHPDGLFRGLQEFREHLGGVLTIMLLRGIGDSVEVHEVDYAVYRTAIQTLHGRVLAREQVGAHGECRVTNVE